jgi:hypothetical protein
MKSGGLRRYLAGADANVWADSGVVCLLLLLEIIWANAHSIPLCFQAALLNGVTLENIDQSTTQRGDVVVQTPSGIVHLLLQ